MTVSTIFKLNKSQAELDFVDIDTDKDTPLFLDPYFIAGCGSPLALKARDTIYSFFQLLLTYLKANDIERARRLFSYLHEPNETCLGVSSGLPQGRGVGGEDFKKIFESLLKSKAVKTGVVEDLEDFRLFVEGFDKDKLSDMTTNIIRGHLLQYTVDQCVLHGIPLTKNTPTGFYWDKGTQAWKNEYSDYLVIGGKKYLLVPKRFASYSKVYTKQQYYQHFILNFLQNEHLSLNSALVQVRHNKQGKIVRRWVTKDSVRILNGHVDKDWIADFTTKHPDVFQKFKTDQKPLRRPLSNEELSNINIDTLVKYLISELRATKPGNDEATKYHRLVTSILHLVFYPNLMAPVLELEIHDGRKRIDLRFDNSADSGFFFRLQERIPAQFIYVECKNYSRDVKNPELDQISGRFGPSRGKAGLILCRQIDDYELFLNRCRDTYKDDRGLVLPLVDNDLEILLGFVSAGKYDEIDNFVQTLYSKIAGG